MDRRSLRGVTWFGHPFFLLRWLWRWWHILRCRRHVCRTWRGYDVTWQESPTRTGSAMQGLGVGVRHWVQQVAQLFIHARPSKDCILWCAPKKPTPASAWVILTWSWRKSFSILRIYPQLLQLLHQHLNRGGLPTCRHPAQMWFC